MQLSHSLRRDVANDAALLPVIEPSVVRTRTVVESEIASALYVDSLAFVSEVAFPWVGQRNLGHGRNSNDEWFRPFREGFLELKGLALIRGNWLE